MGEDPSLPAPDGSVKSARYAHRMRRVAALGLGLLVGLLLASSVRAAGPPFPDPVANQAVYDETGILSTDEMTGLEQQIDAIEGRSGAEIAIYLQVSPSLGSNADANRNAARDLMQQWGVGRAGYDDGLVILVSFVEDRIHGQVATWAGNGFLAAYMNEAALTALREDVLVPAFRQQQVGAGLIAGMAVIDAAITPQATASLNLYRTANAIVGIPGSILALLLTIGMAYVAWRREGDDPYVSDSESVLMAGPPAGMTPPLATVLRHGRADQNSINVLLTELAGSGRISFRNLDRVGKVKRDDDPDPETDPAIEVHAEPPGARNLAKPERQAWAIIQREAAGTGTLTRERLWALNGALGDVRTSLDAEAVRLGWLVRLPMPLIRRWVIIGAAEALAGGVGIWLGFTLPMSGLTLLGGATAIGGAVTIGFGFAMSKRTREGAYVDAMLKAYRRTLAKTMELARSMNEVAAEPTVATLADTPDKAVVWGLALGLHREVAGVLRRGLEAQGASEVGRPAYYPVWLGGGSGPGGMASGGGGLFSGGGIPDVGGMLGALGSLGSAPASSSGGGFGGGGGGGGGGGSSGF
jgi:uncharacterized membrane protein YgcG